MFHLRGEVKATNQPAVEEYLLTVWESVMALTHSVQKHDAPNSLKARFKLHVQSEEERLRVNLELIRYRVDDFATVSLVTGPGRIEMVSWSPSETLCANSFTMFSSFCLCFILF